MDNIFDNENIEPNEYDKSIIVDEGKDFNEITPEYYLKRLIILSQNALIKDNIDAGILQYRMIIEDMEKTAMANSLLDDDYFKIIKDYELSDLNYNDAKQSMAAKNLLLANKKKFEIMKRLFNSKPVKGDLFLK